jgi:hypothetical protein
MFETAILKTKPKNEKKLSARIIEVLLCNSSFNGIDPTLFNDYFVDVLLNDDFI